MRYLVNMSYDGSRFYGYQIQNNEITVEGEVERVLSTILNTNINTIASSRTDRFVHAINQYCHFDYDKSIDVSKLKSSMNKMIDEAIFIKNISICSDDFHSRYGVKSKEYIYKINMGEYNPLERNYIFQYNKKINDEILEKFVKIISGKHNFRSFTSDDNKNDYNRVLLLDYKIEDDVLLLRFVSSGFFRYMIRNIVGLLLDINEGKKTLEDIDYIFKSEDRTSLGLCASGCGLYLNKIEFE